MSYSKLSPLFLSRAGELLGKDAIKTMISI